MQASAFITTGSSPGDNDGTGSFRSRALLAHEDAPIFLEANSNETKAVDIILDGTNRLLEGVSDELPPCRTEALLCCCPAGQNHRSCRMDVWGMIG